LISDGFLAKPFGTIQSFLGEDDGFRLAARVGDVPPLVQPIHGSPIEALPRSRPVVQPEVQ
jgi:hypothetical protein